MTKTSIIELTEEMSNLISAGEVVERPFSVVKELVENSLDAEATSIKIELEEGGLKKIVVTDNGFGLTREEIPLALKRHATSKIKTPNDLFSITTLGFRGEALPSISSVSKFTISSSTNDLDGYQFIYHGGTLISESPCAIKKGTKIEVFDLFYNTPARLKHLSSMAVELSHIISYLNKQAMARLDVAFLLTNNGKVLLHTTGKSTLIEIVGDTYGQEAAKNMISFEGKNNLYSISGITSSNAITRSNRNGITTIINNRIIKNSNIIYAITDAYKTILPIGKYPISILKIECDPSLIDVNVHPSKLEIRFTDENELRQLITKNILISISKKELIIDQLQLNTPTAFDSQTVVKKDEQNNTSNSSTETLWEMFEDAYQSKKETEIHFEETSDTNYEYNNFSTKSTSVAKVEEQINIEPLLKDKENVFFQNFVYIGQFLKTYLLMEYDQTLYLIDQHAAMERFMYEKISRSLSMDTHETYELILPIKLEYSISTIPLIISKKNVLEKLGIEVEEFGPTTIIVRVIPIWIPNELVTEYLRDIINYVINNRDVSKGKMYDSLAKTLSCKKSIKANMGITELEVTELMKKLDQCKMPYTCPHGRPTIIKFTKYELEKMFKRVI